MSSLKLQDNKNSFARKNVLFFEKESRKWTKYEEKRFKNKKYQHFWKVEHNN